MAARLLALLALAASLVAPSAAAAAALPAPGGLRPFLLRADEPVTDTFPRTPSFSWAPYAGAASYDFELATSRSFDDSTIVWSTAARTKPLRVPVVSIPVALPWMTGNPYALYARVRARVGVRFTRWSTPFGFNMRWQTLPEQLAPDYPGLVRWSPIEGATSYEVWFLDAGKVVSTTTNAADEREYYTFHRDEAWTGTVQWRVRAVRKVYGTLPSGLPVQSTGPWSPTFVSANPAPASGPITLQASVADGVSTQGAPAAHGLTPAFVFSGDTGTNGVAARLFRVYVATDDQCVNIVYRGPVVGSPAYAPRTSGPLALPTTSAAVTTAEKGYLADGSQSGTYGADNNAVTTNEQQATSGATSPPAASPPSAATTSPPTTDPATGGSSTLGYTIPSEFSASGPLVDLWDSGWPTGRYYWTVVPVREAVTSGAVKYHDAEVPQDACAAGRVLEFGKISKPAAASAVGPYSSGLSPAGRLVTAAAGAPRFYRAALISWRPAPGAAGYEVQWSKTKSPFQPVSKSPFLTAATSVLLEGLDPGTWYYRVRGIDPHLPGGAKQLSWSAISRVVFVKPRYAVARPAAKKKAKPAATAR